MRSHLVGFFMPVPKIKPFCNACRDTGQVEGMSGALKLCPRCQKDKIRKLREEKWHQPNWHRAVFEHSRATGIARMVLWVLAYNADRFGLSSIPRSVIAHRCRCRPQSVQDAILTLEKLSELRLARKQSGRCPAVYRIMLPARLEARRRKHQADIVDP